MFSRRSQEYCWQQPALPGLENIGAESGELQSGFVGKSEYPSAINTRPTQADDSAEDPRYRNLVDGAGFTPAAASAQVLDQITPVTNDAPHKKGQNVATYGPNPTPAELRQLRATPDEDATYTGEGLAEMRRLRALARHRVDTSDLHGLPPSYQVAIEIARQDKRRRNQQV